MFNQFKKFVYTHMPALSIDNFRYFWTGQCIALIGTWMQRTAQQWLVYTLTDSAFLLGLLGVFQFGPQLLFSLFAGVYIDKIPKKKILWFTQTTLMLQSLALGLLVWSGYVQYWHILLLAFIMGCANTIDMPTRQAFFVEMVGREFLPNAIALNGMIFNLARIIGPALSGVLIAKVGIAGAFLWNFVAFIAVLYALYLIKISNPMVRPKSKHAVFKEISEGLAYIRREPRLFKPILLMLVTSTLALNMEVILPVFTRQALQAEAGVYSMLLSGIGLGALCAGLWIAVKNEPPTFKRIYWGTILVAVSLVVAGFNKSYYGMLVNMFFVGFFNLTFITSVNARLQLQSSDEFRGRVMSVYTLCWTGSTPIGNFLIGSILQTSDVNTCLKFCGVMMLILIAIILKTPHSADEKKL